MPASPEDITAIPAPTALPDRELRVSRVLEHPVVIVGAGPTGLTAALDLSCHGVASVVLDAKTTLAEGSRAICFAQRTLEIWDRLGCADPLVETGITWQHGKTYFVDELVHEFDLLPDAGCKLPAFINLQQYTLEHQLVAACKRSSLIDLRRGHQVKEVTPGPDGVDLLVETPAGSYSTRARWLVAADGVRSTVRRSLGLDWPGRTFADRFLIADIVMRADFPHERRFWFNPPFHPQGSVLLHRQPGNMWRIDFQLSPAADPLVESQPDHIVPRVRALLGPSAPSFELAWASVYTFHSRRMARFVHGRVIFAGDAAHVVSPFGARGANSGVQDAENLAWKLALVIAGRAPEALLATYDGERTHAADLNLKITERTTDFMVPRSPGARALRDAVLDLARLHPFARSLINSGRMSTAASYEFSALNTPDAADFGGGPRPGYSAPDALLVQADGRRTWLLEFMPSTGFVLLWFADRANPPLSVVSPDPNDGLIAHCVAVWLDGSGPLQDGNGAAARRYDARPGTVYLLRPDRHVCGRWRTFEPTAVQAAIANACAKANETVSKR